MPSARRTAPGREAPKLGGGTVTLDDAAFGARFNMSLVHESVRAELAARRRGTASTKTRGEVRGGGAKPWRQKGTGRARAGSSRSPLWDGGGTVFGPRPRNYVFKVNRKERRAALRSALSLHAERGSLAVFDAAEFVEPAAKQAAELLEEWGRQRPVTVLLALDELLAWKSFRNLAGVDVMPVQAAGVADVVGAASLLVSEAAMPALVERAGAPVRRRSSARAGADSPARAGADSSAEAGADSSEEARTNSSEEARTNSSEEAA